MEQGDIAVTDLGAYADSLVVSQLLGSPKHVGDMECSKACLAKWFDVVRQSKC